MGSENGANGGRGQKAVGPMAFQWSKDNALSRLNGRLRTIVETEFRAIFTFIVVVGLQLAYIYHLVSGGSLSEYNIISRLWSHIHVVLMLVGVAALRCAVAFMVKGEHLSEGTIFDHDGKVK